MGGKVKDFGQVCLIVVQNVLDIFDMSSGAEIDEDHAQHDEGNVDQLWLSSAHVQLHVCCDASSNNMKRRLDYKTHHSQERKYIVNTELLNNHQARVATQKG